MINLMGLVLAGGKSQRMGTDKAKLVFREKEMLLYSTEILSKFCKTLYISTNDIKEKQYLFPLLPDYIKNIGPLGGIYSALRIMKDDYLIILPCDTPFVNKELISLLIKNIDIEYDILVPSLEGKLEPLFAVFSKKILPLVENQIQKKDYKIRSLFSLCRTKKIVVDDFISKHCFANINTPKDKKYYE